MGRRGSSESIWSSAAATAPAVSGGAIGAAKNRQVQVAAACHTSFGVAGGCRVAVINGAGKTARRDLAGLVVAIPVDGVAEVAAFEIEKLKRWATSASAVRTSDCRHASSGAVDAQLLAGRHEFDTASGFPQLRAEAGSIDG